ncbi:MAG: hypothetical protein ACFFDK_08285 [Promethearchaeota archaeon]
MPDDRESEDKSITDALSALGWVEEKEKEEQIKSDKSLQEQLKLFTEQKTQLDQQINTLFKEKEGLKTEKANLLNELEEIKRNLSDRSQANIEILKDKDKIIAEKNIRIKQLENEIQKFSESHEATGTQVQAIHELNEIIKLKDNEIMSLNLLINEKSLKIEEINATVQDKQQYIQDMYSSIQEKDDQIKTMENHINQLEDVNVTLNDKNQKIQDLTAQINQNKVENDNLLKQLEEKSNKVRTLEEQINYLEQDTVQKSKFEKTELLLEKKDEIITEKEKALFEIENLLTSANQKIADLQQQLETFNLLKKDLEKKEERIKSLVIENEEKTQKLIANEELLSQIEKKLENTTKYSAQYDIQLTNKDNLIKEKESEIGMLNQKNVELNNKLYEAERIEDKILNDLQKAKDEILKIETKLGDKDKDIIELKKKIKLLRRDMQKT